MNISTFFFKHLRLVYQAQQLAETGLLMNFCAKAWQKPTTRKDLWAASPMHLNSATRTIILLSEIYVHIITAYKRRMDKKGRTGGVGRLYRTTVGGAIGRDTMNDTIADMKETGKSEIEEEEGFQDEEEFATRVGEKEGGRNKKLPVQPQVDVVLMKTKLDFLEARVKKLEDAGLSENQVDALLKFDENVDLFDEVFMMLPQSQAYQRAMVRSSWLTDKARVHVVELERLGDIREKQQMKRQNSTAMSS